LDYKLFDQIIAAFKVRGKQIELCRTTHSKTHSDFIKCTKIPEDTQICFLDDVYYPDMSNDKIYYINIKPYVFDLKLDDMIKRCLNSDILDSNMDTVSYNSFMMTYLKRYNHAYVNKTTDSQNIDKILSKKILEHLHIFFKLKPNQTKTTINKTKKNKIHLNKTLKNKSGKKFKPI
jgi:hypothetical protein